MKITFTVVGRNGDKAIEGLIDRYLKRLTHYVRFDVRQIADVKIPKSATNEMQKDLEGRAILASIEPSDHVILLDERGKEPTSRGFAEIIERHMLGGTRNLVFVVGGPFGFSREVYSRANAMLALSRLTLTHEMVRLFFVEQVYRAFTIIRGESYHHD